MTKEKAERIVRIYNWVRFIILVVFLTFAFVGLANAQTTNDFGTWTQVNVEMSFKEKWNIAGGAELRTKDNMQSVDRKQLAMDGSYKVLPVLKIGAGYEFHAKSQSVNGMKETVPRHRLMLDATTGEKVLDWLKLSLRERYQYTYTVARSNVEATHEYHLRSRFKADVTPRCSSWRPFASVEMFINVSERFGIDEWRIATGTGYSITPHHAISFGYLLDLKLPADGSEKAVHVITAGVYV